MYNENDYNFWLANIPGVGNITINRLLDRFENAEKIFKAKDHEILETEGINIKTLSKINKLREAGINTSKSRAHLPPGMKCTYKTSVDYPKKLKELCDAPFCLYYKGRLPDETVPSVAVVGARGCTEYGKNQAFELSHFLASEGVQIISGLAAGIDTYAHRGALNAGGYTAAITGSGADICYPQINFDIYQSMSLSGGIISEFPPGTTPVAGHFPMRNRIISALSDAVIVIEARERSGSLITADQALEQGRDVYALPGRITDPLSRGCLWLIEQGAYVLSDPKDILSSPPIARKLSLAQKKAPAPEQNTPMQKLSDTDNLSNLSKAEADILSRLNDEPAGLNKLSSLCSLSSEEITTHILNLCLSGLIKEVSPGLYVRIC